MLTPIKIKRTFVCAFLRAAACLLLLLPTAAAIGAEEFVGPFLSWGDLRRDYGAIGDGKADDTAALQRALNDLVKHEKRCVLYIPVGIYRITATLKTTRKAHTDCQGVSIVGEDPARCILRWGGPKDGIMFQWDAWYSKISRLTFDGAGRAGAALKYGPAFSTYNETSDIVFRDAEVGLAFGDPQSNGQAENAVLRCQFLRCETGVQTVNWNSMDIWIWHCRFEDCGRGIYNVMGNWHAWGNLFLRSRVSDMGTANLMVFSAVNNTSVGSRRFFDFSTGHSWGSPVSLTGNRVLDPTGDWAVILDNAGPYLIVDNVFRLPEKTGAVRMTWGDQTLVGNTYSRPGAVEERGRFRRIAEKVAPAKDIPDRLLTLPPTPPRRQRRVSEIQPGADADAIQQAIDRAAKLTGQRPVVYLPMGRYPIDKTLTVPPDCDLQLVGDGGAETATRLDWTGPPGGVLLRLQGPSRATLRDFYLHATNARGLAIENVDRADGRIFADQLNANGPHNQEGGRTAAVRVRGLTRTDVLLRALQGSGNGGSWVEVIGALDAAAAKNQVSIFTGATGSAAGQYDMREGGRLVVRGVYHERSSAALTGLHLRGRGALSIDATRFSYATSAQSPTVAADDFQGMFTLAASLLLPVETKETCRFELRGDGSAASVLSLNNQFWVHQPGVSADTVWRNHAKPRAKGGLIGCNINTSNKQAAPKGFAFLENVGDSADPARSKHGSGPLADRGGVDDATILRHLAPLREARVWHPGEMAKGATDVRIHRVMVSGGRGATVEFLGASTSETGVKTDRGVYPPVGSVKLPSAGGKFRDPVFGTELLRVTDENDGDENQNAYSYWPSFNRDSTLFFNWSKKQNGPVLYEFDTEAFKIKGKRPLFARRPPSGGAPPWEDLIWSGLKPKVMFCHIGMKLFSYDVERGAYRLVKDFTGAAPGAHLGQMSKSQDDRVFGFTLKDAKYKVAGCLVWRREDDCVLLHESAKQLDEVQVDKSGAYCVIKTGRQGKGVVEVKIANLKTGRIEELTDNGTDFAPGHSDNGRGVVVGADNWKNRLTFRRLAAPHQPQAVLELRNDWSQDYHVSLLANDEQWALVSFYASNQHRSSGAFKDEIVQVATDGSQRVQRLAHHRSVVRGYWDSPRANISRDGRFVLFTSNWEGKGQRDVFILKVPPAP